MTRCPIKLFEGLKIRRIASRVQVINTGRREPRLSVFLGGLGGPSVVGFSRASGSHWLPHNWNPEPQSRQLYSEMGRTRPLMKSEFPQHLKRPLPRRQFTLLRAIGDVSKEKQSGRRRLASGVKGLSRHRY